MKNGREEVRKGEMLAHNYNITQHQMAYEKKYPWW